MDLSDFASDNSRNIVLKSIVPQVCKDEPCCLGIDEAGRGPVLGPMVYGVSFCPVSCKERLADLGFADSKTLTEEQRDNLFSKIKQADDFIGFEVEVLSPNFISTAMLRRTKYSLNAISMDSAIGLLNLAIQQGANIKEVYVDTVGDSTKYQEKLQGLFPGLDITVTPKADAKFPIVSAASICAKVMRDQVLKSWTFKEGDDIVTGNYGSGYPADPSTKQWLLDNVDKVFGYPQFVRFSWSTTSTILESKARCVHWDDDEEDTAKGSASLFSFFAPKNADPKDKQHSFFEERHLKRVVSF
ncbi:ribonuclease H2 subunit A-like isoform X1 [Asterias rubens]|uniref:ribonuclease H2 subunit A-like isoform X1 n=1 Tax=Asterias rubens TaxID=7604 RepID=UPI00145556D2|nr:ribonuclease H2 subunit A-like isoform X1 [Asterias rubens]